MDTPNTDSIEAPKRKKIFLYPGFQVRYAALVAGALLVMLLFAGFHAFFVARTALSPTALKEFEPILETSTWRLFAVGLMYIAVVTIAAIFISHRIVGPAQRLEEEIAKIAESTQPIEPLHVREGDEFEGLVGAINKLVEKVRGPKQQ
jgi:methyl-accepting chemotaxis protein